MLAVCVPGLLQHRDDEVGGHLALDADLRYAIPNKVQQRNFALQLKSSRGLERLINFSLLGKGDEARSLERVFDMGRHR